MAYQVLARKWRPQVFEAVVGQDAITRTLKNALVSGRIAHAYLFARPRGVGKTTTARLLARALLCPERTGPEPCGACAVCREALAGTLVDVLEIDGASNRGIEEIRTLRENVKYAPARGRYKVYIIDEVHQLTEPAFNALLKTLEEPPSHVVFLLATTDPRDIPATVLSRLQRFDFRPIAPDALTDTLERILREEKIPFEPAALVAHDTPAALEAIDRTAREGEDLQAFARDVVEVLRRALVLKAAPTAKLADLTHQEGNELRKLGEAASLDEILYVLRAFLEADALMRESPHPRVELEIATVRATRRPVPQALDDVLRRVDEAQAQLRQQSVATGAAQAPAAQASLLPEAAPSAARPTPEPRRAPNPPAPPARPTAPPQAAPRSTPPPGADLATAWERVVDEVMRRKATLGAVLAQAEPRSVSEGTLTIVLTGNHFHREMLADSANRDVIVQVVRRYVQGVERIDVQAGGAGPGGVAAHPDAQAAVAEFQGEVVAVRPRQPEGEGQ